MTGTKKSTELFDVERLFADFITSNVGLAVLDSQLRYCALNPFLAASNGTSAESHLGKHVQHILGGVARQVEPAIQEVFASARTVLNCEVAGRLPTRPAGGHWICNFFPIVDFDGSVKQVGVVVLELPLDVELQTNGCSSVSSGVLRSWKDIAKYVGTCVKTVQRWEHTYQFPIRRVNPHKGAVVFALQKDVDTWLLGKTPKPGPGNNAAAIFAPFSMSFSPCAPGNGLIVDPAFEADWIRRSLRNHSKTRHS
ncbi:MAG TPA: PAS domain-containing protein [Candidatus Sulfotelmatobacter sp.]|nr:PAS domain-containing protein [Candidatus Sulfotelmatobacter sp.]